MYSSVNESGDDTHSKDDGDTIEDGLITLE